MRERKGTYRYLIVGLLTLLISTSLVVTAFAGQYEDADAAYERGDYATAYRLFKPMAEQGHAEAQYNLGGMYFRGRGVPQDFVLAHMWFNLSVSKVPASEGETREATEIIIDLVASKMTPYQIAEAQRLAREWKPKGEGK